MVTFSADFADRLGVSLEDVRAPMALSFTRNRAASVAVELDVESDQAIALVNALRIGLPRMRVWRRNSSLDDEARLILNAPWAPMQETAEDGDQTSGTLTGQFRDPFALYEQRFTAPTLSYVATDAGALAWNLLALSNAGDGDTGLIQGTIEATIARDRTYEHKQLAESIIQLTQVQGGFDFEVTPLDVGATIGEFNVYARQGQDRSTGSQAVVFEFGPGTIANVSRVERQTTAPINRARVVGANGLIAVDDDLDSVAKYGTFMVIDQAVDITEQATLDARATSLLRPDPIRVVAFTPDPARAPQPWDDFWLGDTVRFRARFGSIDLDIAVRVNGIEMQIDEDGNLSAYTLIVDQAS